MSQVIGQLLPLAVGVAISPIPIIAVILMLLSTRAGAASTGFLIGWVTGITVVTVVVVVIAEAAGLDNTSGPSSAASWIKIVLGGLLLLLAVKNWRDRPRKGETVEPPKWMSAIDTMTAGRAGALGFVLAAVNPKNTTLCIAAGAVVGAASLSTGGTVVAVVVFVIVAASSVAVPVVGYAVAGQRMRAPLDRLRSWLVANNATVMAVLLLAIGTVLVGRGIEGL